MKLGIVGSEGAKFTEATQERARWEIRRLLTLHKPELVVSGGCHLGGIDIWATEEAALSGYPFKEYIPQVLAWDPYQKYGYKARNLDIAKSDLVVCITVATLPEGYKGMRFQGCYHCKDRNPPHIKSGGCWTAWRAPAREWIIL